MDQQRLLLDVSPVFILLCALVAVAYAVVLYRRRNPWSSKMNRILFALRTVLVFFLAFLLLGPIVRQIRNFTEKPLFVIVQDNSGSLLEVEDSTSLQALQDRLITLGESMEEAGYDVQFSDLDGEQTARPRYEQSSTDLQKTLKTLSDRYEGKKFGGVMLVSDGIYNTGMSPLYASYNFPVHTLGIGDTTERIDITIRNLSFNKIAYEGNKFPIRVEVLLKGINESVGVNLLHRGKTLDRQVKAPDQEQLLVFDFQPQADEKGIQKYDIQVDTRPEEFNKRNNVASVFVEVVEGKKKILLVAPTPHPDVKAIRSVVEKNSNYEFLLHIPSVSELPAQQMDPSDIDLVIFHQAPDQRGTTKKLVTQFMSGRSSVFFILGTQTDLPWLTDQRVPLSVEGNPRDFDDVTPTVNAAFNSFDLTSEATSRLSEFPPVQVPFGKINFTLNAKPLLFQKVGSLTTDKPLLAIDVQDERKIAILLGEGIWRWRLDEYEDAEQTTAFDEMVGKLIQYLSTTEDKRKFRSYPVQQEFSDTEPVIFESQVYNDIFEPVYGNSIDIQLRNERNESTRYTYVTNPGNTRYSIGGLSEGVYRYVARTTIDGKLEAVEGQFAVVTRLAELQNLTADFDLLRKLSDQSGGTFYTRDQLQNLTADLTLAQATGVIRTEESFNSMINLKWIFWAFLVLISVEWFTRKYMGSY